MKETTQRYGGFLAAMITPNIGAFIVWGLDMDILKTM